MRATQTEATKTCPWCAETIKAAAVRCRFCRSDLPAAAPVDEPRAEPAETTPGPDEPAPIPPASSGRARPPWRRVAPVLVGLLVVALVAALVLAVLEWRELSGRADARISAQVAATGHVAAVLSYDAEDFDASTERATEVMTADFRRQYEDTLELVREDATERGAAVVAEVTTAAVVSATPDRVRLLLFVNQTTTRTGEDEPRVDLNRVEVVLVRSDEPDVDGWKVADLQAL